MRIRQEADRRKPSFRCSHRKLLSTRLHIRIYAHTPGSRQEEAVIPVLSSEVARRSFCLRNCRGQLVNVPDVHSLKHGPLKIPSCKRDFYSCSGSLNANQLLDSFTCHSLLPQVSFMAVYGRSACQMLNTPILWIRCFSIYLLYCLSDDCIWKEITHGGQLQMWIIYFDSQTRCIPGNRFTLIVRLAAYQEASLLWQSGSLRTGGRFTLTAKLAAYQETGLL